MAKLTQGGIIPYGKASPSVANLLQCAIYFIWGGGGVRNHIDGELLPYVAVEVLGASTRVGHRSCTQAFLHVGTHKVITWALCSLYKE